MSLLPPSFLAPSSLPSFFPQFPPSNIIHLHIHLHTRFLKNKKKILSRFFFLAAVSLQLALAMAEEAEEDVNRCPFQDAFDGEMIVADIVSSIVDSSYEVIKEHYIRERLSAYSASAVLQDLFDVVRTGHLSRDAGNEDAPTSSEWNPEEEPESSALDSWARGRVKVMTKPKEIESTR